MLSLALNLTLAHRLFLESDYLETCLPKTEAFLKEHGHLVRLLRDRIGEDVFRSVMDAVICCFLPNQVEACRAFYAGKGKRLVELVSAKTLTAMDAHLLNSVRMLSGIYREIVRNELWAKGKGHDAKALDAALEAVGWRDGSVSGVRRFGPNDGAAAGSAPTRYLAGDSRRSI